jgi:hypothetical protein
LKKGEPYACRKKKEKAPKVKKGGKTPFPWEITKNKNKIKGSESFLKIK